MATGSPQIGTLIRTWRERRRYSQLSLAIEADISQRHLSFLESGRSRPSRDMLLRLSEQLAIPLRERNALLVAGGFAPHYPQHKLDAPEMSAVREAVERILTGHLPHPALAVDRYWTLLSANNAVHALLAGVEPSLLSGEVNVLRASLHPGGLAPRIANFSEWRHHVLMRLEHDTEVSCDARLAELRDELASYPVPAGMSARPPVLRESGIAVPLRLKSPEGELSFVGTTTVFGSAVDITLADLVIEAFFPADASTAEVMARMHQGSLSS